MNENLDLAEILKGCPRGTKLYSPLCGEVALDSVDEDYIYYPIKANRDGLQLTFARDGRFHRKFNGECMLYPSKDQRDWSKFKAPVEKYKRVVEISRELDMLNKVVKELNDPAYTTTLRFCYTWNQTSDHGKWKPCNNMDCISKILARHTVMVIHEIQERRNQLHKEIEEL